MGTKEDYLDNMYNDLNKKREKDKKKRDGAQTFRASDIRIGSHIPYGILTRIPQLDLCMGRPGYPVGRIVELYGLPRTGKTTAGLMAIAQTQAVGGDGHYIDTEYTFDADRAEELGVNTDTCRYTNVDTIEDAFRTTTNVIESLEDYGDPFTMVIDSVGQAATEWESTKNRDYSSDRPGDQAKAIKRGLRLITPLVAKKGVLLILVNHAYETMAAWGKSSRSSGGHGIKFNASLRVNFSHISEHREDVPGTKEKIRLGQVIKMQVEKLKTGHLELESFNVHLLNDGGFDTYGSLLFAMEKIGLVKHENPHANYEWGETSFPRKEWRNVVDSNGGLTVVYKEFIRKSCENGYMKEYSSKDLEDD